MVAEMANRYDGQLVKVSTSEEPELYAIGTLEITSEYDHISGKGQLVISSEDADSYRYHVDETVVNLTGSGTLIIENDLCLWSLLSRPRQKQLLAGASAAILLESLSVLALGRFQN